MIWSWSLSQVHYHLLLFIMSKLLLTMFSLMCLSWLLGKLWYLWRLTVLLNLLRMCIFSMFLIWVANRLHILIRWVITRTNLWWLSYIPIRLPYFNLLSVWWRFIVLLVISYILSLYMVLLLTLLIWPTNLLLLSPVMCIVNLLYRLSTYHISFLINVVLVVLLCDLILTFIGMLLWNLVALRL